MPSAFAALSGLRVTGGRRGWGRRPGDSWGCAVWEGVRVGYRRSVGVDLSCAARRLHRRAPLFEVGRGVG